MAWLTVSSGWARTIRTPRRETRAPRVRPRLLDGRCPAVVPTLRGGDGACDDHGRPPRAEGFPGRPARSPPGGFLLFAPPERPVALDNPSRVVALRRGRELPASGRPGQRFICRNTERIRSSISRTTTRSLSRSGPASACRRKPVERAARAAGSSEKVRVGRHDASRQCVHGEHVSGQFRVVTAPKTVTRGPHRWPHARRTDTACTTPRATSGSGCPIGTAPTTTRHSTPPAASHAIRMAPPTARTRRNQGSQSACRGLVPLHRSILRSLRARRSRQGSAGQCRQPHRIPLCQRRAVGWV